MERRWFILIAALVLYVAMLSVTWTLTTQRADSQTQSMLDYAIENLEATLNGSIDTMLMHVGQSIVKELGQSRPVSTEELNRLAAQHWVDEINVTDRTGRNLGSTDPKLVGTSFADKPKAAEFLILTDGVHQAFSQPFRAGAHNPEVRRKYVGIAFPKGEGLLQVGLDETRLSRILPSIMGFVYDKWLLGETGFFLCADLEDGHLISNPARHSNEATTLAETGYTPLDPNVKEDGKTTFRQRLFGSDCYCRAVIFGEHRIIAALPPSEYYVTRTVYEVVMAVVLALVLTLFVLMLWRIEKDAGRLRAFYTSEAEKQAAELDLGRTIQMAVLPTEFPETEHFRISASMTAAKEVGGDFYDFFPLDETHQAFLIADVSGKGVTGALYMMNARTLLKDTLLSETAFDPAAALTRVNAELCHNNPAEMFVTAWVGVLDLESGRIIFANAGHNPPLRLRNHEQPEWLRQRSGCPLACFETVTYKCCETCLKPGETLFLYTDGVTEAMDKAGGLFGEERLANMLEDAVGDDVTKTAPRDLVQAVRRGTEDFAAGAPQADDITLLAVQYLAALEVHTRTFPCNEEALATISAHLSKTLDKENCPKREKAQLMVALDEVISNIIRHSGATGIKMDVQFSHSPPGATVTLADDGEPFNPLDAPLPDTTLPLEERPIGGLGILLLRKTMDKVEYHYAHGCNVISFQRIFGKKDI